LVGDFLYPQVVIESVIPLLFINTNH